MFACVPILPRPSSISHSGGSNTAAVGGSSSGTRPTSSSTTPTLTTLKSVKRDSTTSKSHTDRSSTKSKQANHAVQPRGGQNLDATNGDNWVWGGMSQQRSKAARVSYAEPLTDEDEVSESEAPSTAHSEYESPVDPAPSTSLSAATSQSSKTATATSLRKSLPRAPALDFSAIRTSAPAVMPQRKRDRPFGLQHCPVFFPTIDEFARPMEYIEQIAQQAQKQHYGICKVVPPENWQPPFALDTETFRFGTRMQQLNSMEASARANLNFVEQLTIFHRQHRHSKITMPTSGGKPIDLWVLRKEVNALGGFKVICEQRLWSKVGRALGLDTKTDHGVAALLRTAYEKIIQPFETYRKKVKTTLTPDGHRANSGSPAPGGMRKMAAATQPAQGKVSLAAQPVSMDEVKAASAKLTNALNASTLSSGSGSSGEANGMGRAFSPTLAGPASPCDSDGEPLSPSDYCQVCKSEEDDKSILLCDECDAGYHLKCLDPPLKSVPKGDWVCDPCIVNKGDDYGFEEGDEHDLSSFHKRAHAFRQRWLRKHPAPDLDAQPEFNAEKGEDWEAEVALEDHVEREFWRLVESLDDTVEVEYGADIHTTKWGSAIPTIESHPTEPYARDGWNLNNLYVKSDISGMTVPWGYVGMMFSTFAWHKEDHNTYSVNYHHIGGTKTWYGVPGEDDEKLEAAMKAAAPELFEQQPDLMYQLVTLMSPGRLQQAGVRVSACDQRPNEFVITFPKAYHAGFNHDFNYNEAVNFCLPDWLQSDLEGVKKYKAISKPPVFSHDELLITIYNYERTQKASRWLLPLFDEMVHRELQRREHAKASIPDLKILQEDLEQEDEHYQCSVDKSFCYLSQLATSGSSEIACVDHWQSLPAGEKIMKVRFVDEDLKTMLARVRRRANTEDLGESPDSSKRKAADENSIAVQEENKRARHHLEHANSAAAASQPAVQGVARLPAPTSLPAVV